MGIDIAQADKHFDKYRALYEEAVRKHVCERCIDFGEDRQCHNKDKWNCSIIKNLREMVHIARAVHANKVDPYIETLRKNICAHCENEKPDGSCNVRKEVECCLDRYLPLVLDAIEDVDRRIKA